MVKPMSSRSEFRIGDFSLACKGDGASELRAGNAAALQYSPADHGFFFPLLPPPFSSFVIAYSSQKNSQ